MAPIFLSLVAAFSIVLSSCGGGGGGSGNSTGSPGTGGTGSIGGGTSSLGTGSTGSGSGGITPTPIAYHPLAALNNNGVWSTKASMAQQRDNTANAVANGKIYVMAGAPAGLSVLASMERYDPLTNTWTTVAPLPAPRYGPSAAVANGYIYAIGGTSAVNGSGPIPNLAVYDPTADVWSNLVPSTPATLASGTAGQPLAPLPTPRWGLRSVTVDGIIYAVGGSMLLNVGGKNTYYGTVEAYDPINNRWTPKTPMPTPREGMSLGVVNGQLYAIGGWGGWPELGVVEMYDPVSDSWSTTVPNNGATQQLGTSGAPLTPMPTARDDFGYAVVDGQVLNISGDTNAFNDYNRTPCCTNVVEAYDPMLNTWSTKAAAPTIRDDFEASYLDGVVYAIAGSRDNVFTANPTPPTTTSPPATALTPAFINANGGGFSLTTTEALALSPIATPTGLQATASGNQITLTWQPSNAAISYNLYWSNKAGVATTANSTAIASVSSPYTFTGVTLGQWYYVVVTAVTASGESLPSSEVAVRP